MLMDRFRGTLFYLVSFMAVLCLAFFLYGLEYLELSGYDCLVDQVSQVRLLNFETKWGKDLLFNKYIKVCFM